MHSVQPSCTEQGRGGLRHDTHAVMDGTRECVVGPHVLCNCPEPTVSSVPGVPDDDDAGWRWAMGAQQQAEGGGVSEPRQRPPRQQQQQQPLSFGAPAPQMASQKRSRLSGVCSRQGS
jgi:hypothetical protein